MGNSFLLIVAGLLLFYLVVSDKWNCVEGFAACVTGKTNGQNSVAPTGFPQVPKTPMTFPQTIKTPSLQTLAMQSNWANTYGF